VKNRIDDLNLFNPPIVSIIIPLFNMEKYLTDTLESILNQTFKSFEVIIVDDCSTDASPDIAKKFVDRDNRFKYFKLTTNSNRPSIPRNIGISRAVGRYIAFLDHDDLWFSKKLERQIQVLENRPDLAMVHSHLWDFTERSKIRGFVLLSNPYRRIASYGLLRKHNVVQCSSVLVRSDVIKKLNGFDERIELRAIEDYQLWLRLSEHFKVAYISEIHGLYRNSLNSTSTQLALSLKHEYLDTHMGTIIKDSTPPLVYRMFRKLVTFPLAIYFHLIDGIFRYISNSYPRLFESKN
jgi:glycosyltransferase involved in cell wall biosynthesis